MRRSIADYPPNWKEIAIQVKNEAGWKCVRCGISHQPGYILTVHHLDLNPSNNEWWNIPALCQRCHLRIQAKVVMERYWMFEHSDWFKPYVAGYYANQLNLPTNKEWVITNADHILSTFNVQRATF